MADVAIFQMPPFKRAYKKLHPQQKSKVDEAIKEIVCDPEKGEQKKGDLSSVWVYKFKIDRQEQLLAYQWNPSERILLLLGTHENFYRNLKR